MEEVLCVCFGNTCRSPMMAAKLQRMLGDGYKVESAGTNFESVGQPANEHSVLCMREEGFDLSGHQSRWVVDLKLNRFSAIVCVDETIALEVESLLKMQEVSGVVVMAPDGGIDNPFKKGLIAYRACVARLDEVLPPIAQRIREISSHTA